MPSKYEENLITIKPKAKDVRSYVVSKTNEFVRLVPYPKLTVIQSKILAFMLSQVQPGDTEFKDVDFSYKTFVETFKMNENSHSNIKKAILGLRANPVFTLVNPETQGKTAMTWCHVYMEEKTGLIRLRLDEDLERYFLNINPKEGFINYHLFDIMNLSCKYSFWFFDQFMLGKRFGKKNLEINYIKEQLDLSEKYTAKLIKSRIINPVMEDINTNTDYYVTYETVKKGTRVVEYKFKFGYKDRNSNLYASDTDIMFKVSEDDTRHIVIINYLNKKAQTNFNPDDRYYISLIRRWLEEGYDVIDFKEVIDYKVSDWKNNEFSKYLTPEVLFGDKFVNYIYKTN